MLLDRGQGCKRSRVQREAGKEGIPLQEMWCSGSCMQREVEKTGIPLQSGGRKEQSGGKIGSAIRLQF